MIAVGYAVAAEYRCRWDGVAGLDRVIQATDISVIAGDVSGVLFIVSVWMDEQISAVRDGFSSGGDLQFGARLRFALGSVFTGHFVHVVWDSASERAVILWVSCRGSHYSVGQFCGFVPFPLILAGSQRGASRITG